jgi:hypothetical protein
VKIQTPILFNNLVTRLSEERSLFFKAEPLLRLVLSAVSINMAVALASAIEHAFPWRISATQRRAAAMFLILVLEAAKNNHLKQTGLLIGLKPRMLLSQRGL